VGGAAVEGVAVEVDGACCSGDEGDECGFGAFADDRRFPW